MSFSPFRRKTSLLNSTGARLLAQEVNPLSSERSIGQIRRDMKKDVKTVLADNHYSQEDVRNMVQKNQIVCVKKSKGSTSTVGKQFLLAIDGSRDSTRAIRALLAEVIHGDNVLIVCAVKQFDASKLYWLSDEEVVALNAKLKEAAIEILNRYNKKLLKKLKKKGVEYALLVPTWKDPRESVVALANKYFPQKIVMAKHSRQHLNRTVPRKSFRKYLRDNVKKSELLIV